MTVSDALRDACQKKALVVSEVTTNYSAQLHLTDKRCRQIPGILRRDKEASEAQDQTRRIRHQLLGAYPLYGFICYSLSFSRSSSHHLGERKDQNVVYA